MIRKFLSKYILEVIPSIVATVVGAYIVTHYINAKPDAGKPQAAVSAPAQKSDTILPKAAKLDPAKAAPVKSEPTKSESAKSEPAKPETAKSEPSDKSETAKSETTSEPRRHQPQPREKAAAKTSPAEKAASAEPAAKAEEDRDANEIARAAIERLRKSDPAQPVVQEAARAPEPQRPQPRVSVTYQPSAPAPIQQPQVQNPQVQPPMVSAAPPLPEVSVAPAPQPIARIDNDPSRPMPPADIPERPMDIRARQADRTTVAEDVVSAAKSVFQAVIPGTH